MRLFGRFLILVLAAILLVPPSVSAQTDQKGRLTITVADPSGAVVPNATVTLTGLEAPVKVTPVPEAKTTDKGLVVFEDLLPGRYSVRAEFPGFQIGQLPDIRVTRGDNKQVVILPLQTLAESVTVDAGAQAADRASRAFGLTVTDEQVQALSDDPDEMTRQLNDIAGSGAVIRVDSFEGQQMPPKSQIKSIHVTRDQFAAETEQPGSTFVDIVTQPGIGPIRGGANGSFRDGSMSARSQFTPTKGPEQIRGYGFNVGGALIKQVSNFSIAINGQDNFSTPNLNVALPTGTRFDVLNLRQPVKVMNLSGLLDYALTRDQTLRFGYSQSNNSRENQGIGSYDLPERAFKSDNNRYSFRALEAGPIGRRTFINTRLAMNWTNFGNQSSVEAPTIIVQDAFTTGGAQQAGRVNGRNLTFASDVDYVRGMHSWRGGVQVYADWYNANLSNNYLGTYVFSNLAAYEAGAPLLYTRSVGDPQFELLPRPHRRVLSGRPSNQERTHAESRPQVQLSDPSAGPLGVRAAPRRHLGAR